MLTRQTMEALKNGLLDTVTVLVYVDQYDQSGRVLAKQSEFKFVNCIYNNTVTVRPMMDNFKREIHLQIDNTNYSSEPVVNLIYCNNINDVFSDGFSPYFTYRNKQLSEQLIPYYIRFPWVLATYSWLEIFTVGSSNIFIDRFNKTITDVLNLYCDFISCTLMCNWGHSDFAKWLSIITDEPVLCESVHIDYMAHGKIERKHDLVITLYYLYRMNPNLFKITGFGPECAEVFNKLTNNTQVIAKKYDKKTHTVVDKQVYISDVLMFGIKIIYE